MKAPAKTLPKAHVCGKRHRFYCTGDPGDEAHVLKREGIELEETRKVSIVDEEMR